MMLNQAEDNTALDPVEPASKRSKLRNRVSSKGRAKRAVAEDSDTSSTDSDNVPLSQVAVKGGRGANASNGRATGGRGKKSQIQKVGTPVNFH